MQVLFFFSLRQVSAFPAWMHFLNTHGEYKFYDPRRVKLCFTALELVNGRL